MPGLQKFEMGGVDLKSSDLVRPPLKASNLRNVVKNQKGDIITRFGYVPDETLAGETEEVVYRKSGNEDLAIRSDGTIYKNYNGVRKLCSIANLEPNVGLTLKNRIVTAEYLSNLYITTTDGKTPLIKYDGSDAYLAGLPAPTVKYDGLSQADISNGGAGYFYRFFYQFKDLNGNVTFGPYNQLQSTVNNATITVSTFKTGNPFGKFYNKYMTIGYFELIPPGPAYNVTQASNFLYAYSHNYNIGDKLMIDSEDCIYISNLTGAKRKFIVLTITNIEFISANKYKITFDPAELAGISFTIATNADGKPLDCRLKLRSFRSTSATAGFVECSPLFFTTGNDIKPITFQVGQPIDNSQDNQDSISIASSLFFDYTMDKFEDVYNEEKQKLRPPLCKAVCALGNQLIFPNVVGVWDQQNNFTQYNNDDIFMWSDFGLSDNGENHSGDFELVGETYNGAVTGARRCNDLLLLTKDTGIYAVGGAPIEAGSFVVRKIPTNYVGCVSQNSILEVEAGVFFQGNDGIYFTDGVSARKMTTELDPFFNTIIPERTKATVNRTQNKFVFYVTDGANHYAVVFDYHFKEWFIWENVDMSKGLFEKNDKTLVFAKGTKKYHYDTNFSDDTAVIDAYYATNWEDLKNPSINKKFKYLRIWNLSDTDTTFTMKVQKDWKEVDVDTVIVTIPAKSAIQKGFEQMTCKAIRFIFEKVSNSAPLIVSAHELEYEPIQKSDKGN